MSLLDLFHDKIEKVSLIIHLSSGAITGAFVSYIPDQLPRLLKQLSLSYVGDGMSQMNTTDASAIERMTKCLDTVLAQLFAQKIKINDITVLFSSPWCGTETHTVHIKQDKKFIITQPFLTEVVRVEADAFVAEMKKTHTDSTEEYEVIEKNILQSTVNGYSVENPHGMRTNVFDLSVHLACVARPVVSAVFETIFHHTHLAGERVSLHTMYFVSYSVLHSLFPMDYIYMDVLGEATCIFLVQNGMPAKTITFPSGTRFVVDQVAKKCSVTAEIALSMLRVVFSGKADDELSQKIKTILTDIEKEWAIYFEDALVSLSPHGILDGTLPTKIFVSATTDIAPLYVEFLTIAKTDATALYRKQLQVVPVTADTVASQYAHNPRESFNAPVALATIFHMQKHQ